MSKLICVIMCVIFAILLNTVHSIRCNRQIDSAHKQMRHACCARVICVRLYTHTQAAFALL